MYIEDYWGYIRVDPIIAIEEVKDTRIGLLDHQGREICKNHKESDSPSDQVICIPLTVWKDLVTKLGNIETLLKEIKDDC